MRIRTGLRVCYGRENVGRQGTVDVGWKRGIERKRHEYPRDILSKGSLAPLSHRRVSTAFFKSKVSPTPEENFRTFSIIMLILSTVGLLGS